MKFLLAFAFITTSFVANSQTNEKKLGEIKGSVTDASGNVVRGATVYVIPQDISFENIAPRSNTTSAAGDFDFQGGFVLGTYKVFAKKETDGYPDPGDKFYADSKVEPSTVELTEDHPSVEVNATLGNRADVLAGRVTVPIRAHL